MRKKARKSGDRRQGTNRARVLATSFVVTVGSVQGVAACKKPSVLEPEVEESHSSVYRGPNDGLCYRTQSMRCPKGASCNPPPPVEVDCPPDLRDAGGDPPAISRRPPGKEDWLRVTPQLTFVNDAMGCIYIPEWFCPPVTSTSNECTRYPETVKVACSLGADAGARRFGSFVYKDGLGSCRQVTAGECPATFRGRCTVPDGVVVPCAAAPVAQ